jgi:cbb3-type cytochrome oxidase subunit 3
VIAVAFQLAAAGTTTGAGLMTLVVPISLVIVVLGVWWFALRRGRTPTADAASQSPASREDPPPSALQGP